MRPSDALRNHIDSSAISQLYAAPCIILRRPHPLTSDEPTSAQSQPQQSDSQSLSQPSAQLQPQQQQQSQPQSQPQGIDAFPSLDSPNAQGSSQVRVTGFGGTGDEKDEEMDKFESAFPDLSGEVPYQAVSGFCVCTGSAVWS